MRKEASIQEWKDLYQAATKIKELKPWEHFWDMDLIGIQEGNEEDTVFFSVLGRGGGCYGLVAYEGYEGLNDFLMLTMSESMNLSMEYAMFSQHNLTCYWGNRDELSGKQREIIKELGYKYRGKNQWLYFMSYCAGYYPYNYDQDEVQRMTRYLGRLADALEYYKAHDMDGEFENANMYLYSYDRKMGQWGGQIQGLPFTMYRFNNLIITDDKLMEELSRAPRNQYILEADISYLGTQVSDKMYERPANPPLCLIVEAASEMILKADMLDPEEDPNVALAENLIGFIMEHGAPKEIRVTNVIMEAVLEHLCEAAGIRLRRVKHLAGLDGLREGMARFM